MKKINKKGFTLVEVLVSIAIFLIFSMAIYGGVTFVFKIVYSSRMQILETALISEQLEIIRNIPFDDVGIVEGVPEGVIPHSQVITRNNVDFTIITTVRNIDDPFDGTVGGIPNDTSPADYKLVEVSAICINCVQRIPVILNTIIAPKGLEGASDNGHIFINVFNAQGLPVSQANVHVVNSATDPDTVIDDVTGNDGWLKIIDTSTGTLSYHITVSKNGYSSDYTIEPSAENTNPTKLPSNVVTQMVTEIYFSIDELAHLNINTINESCSGISNVTFNMTGEKVIGTEPILYKLDEDKTTNGSGVYEYTNLEWDNYYFSATSSGYMLAGSIPQLSAVIEPGQTQAVYLILKPIVTNSLLVNVRDSGTGLPLSDVEVNLYKVGYNETKTTDLGYIRQTDWSGGLGQADFVNEDEYYSDNGSVDINSPVGDIKLKKVGSSYLSSAVLESSTFDLGSGVDFKNIIWEPLSQDADVGEDSILFQMASSNSSTLVSWDFYGPDGAVDTYYTPTTTLIWSGHDDDRYFRYKLFLHTDDAKKTPQLSEVAFTYTNDCTPPGQVFFSGFSAGTYTLDVGKTGYILNTGELDLADNLDTIVNLSVDE